MEAEGDLEVVGEAKNGRQAVELAQKLRPAVVVMDMDNCANRNAAAGIEGS